MKKAFITGTNGFIGKRLKESLNDHEIFEINEDIFDDFDWIDTLKYKLNNTKPNVIFHVGACSDTLETNVNYMMVRNFESTKIISDYCSVNNIPLIYSSSAANYGTTNEYPSNLYGWSKYVAEQYVISNGGIALRYFNVYGPGEENKGKMSSVAYQMIQKDKQNIKVRLFPFNPKRDFVYINDVIDSNIFAYENYGNIPSGFYDVGYGEPRSFEDVMDILQIGYSYHDDLVIPKGYQFYTCSDKNKWLPNWEPKYNLEDGLKDYITSLHRRESL